MAYDPFDATMEQILEAEREMRKLAEKESLECRKILLGLLTRFAPGEVERMKKEDPTGWNRVLDPEKIGRMIVEASIRRTWYSAGAPARSSPDIAELERLREENAKLKLQLERLREEMEKSGETEREARPNPETQRRPVDPEVAIPPFPPLKFRSLFRNWQREGFVIALMAETGWSMRLAIAEVLVARDENLKSANTGSVRRMLRRMEKEGLVTSQTTTVGRARATMMSLTDKGRDAARAMGFDPVESEWERLMRLHGGDAQAKHAGMVCTFTYHARKRGWSTEVCPAVGGNADPDVLIEKDGQRVYVEVEGESGSDERRMKKWRNMADFQGFVALVAVNEAMRGRLVSEAKGASKRGMATDIQYLIQNPEGDLWAETW